MAISSVEYDYCERINHSLEPFSLVWLDMSYNADADEEMQKELQSIINHVVRFSDKEECKEYIGQRTKDDRIVLISSGRLGREIVPDIHQYRQVVSIYIYCMDKETHDKWACIFAKVKLNHEHDNFIFTFDLCPHFRRFYAFYHIL